jgi:hypothetical protein
MDETHGKWLILQATAHFEAVRLTLFLLGIVHIKNDPPIKSLKRRSLSGAEGSAIELIKFIGVGFEEISNGSIISRSILEPLKMSIDEFKYLWDGSEHGWFLQHIDHVVWHLIIHFGEMGPSNLEISKLHKVLPELNSKKITSIYTELKGHSIYRTQENYGNIKSRALYSQAIELGLNVELESEQIGGYLPISINNFALIIEDASLANIVVKNMIEAGVSIVEVHVD